MSTWPRVRVAVPRVMSDNTGAEVTPGHRGHAAATNDTTAATVGTVDAANELLEGCLLLELVHDGVQGLGSLLVVRLVVAHHSPLRSARIHRCGSNQT